MEIVKVGDCFYVVESEKIKAGLPLTQEADQDASRLMGSKPRGAGWEKKELETVKNHPYCALCGTKKRLQVHHKKPYHEFPELEFEDDNLIVLCQPDHFSVGHYYNWQDYNPDVDQEVAARREKILQHRKAKHDDVQATAERPHGPAA